LDDVTLLHVATGDRVLDGGDDRVADAGVATTRAAENTDAKDLLRTGVVGDLEPRLLLDHWFLLVVEPVLLVPGTGSLAELVVGNLVSPERKVTWPSRRPGSRASAWSRTADGSP